MKKTQIVINTVLRKCNNNLKKTVLFRFLKITNRNKKILAKIIFLESRKHFDFAGYWRKAEAFQKYSGVEKQRIIFPQTFVFIQEFLFYIILFFSYARKLSISCMVFFRHIECTIPNSIWNVKNNNCQCMFVILFFISETKQHFSTLQSVFTMI